MTWNYRLMRRVTPDETTVAIHEVYYDESGAIKSWTLNPCHPMGDGFEGDAVKSLATTLGMMFRAFAEPVLEYPVGTETDSNGMTEVDYASLETALYLAHVAGQFEEAARRGEPATWERAAQMARAASPDRVIPGAAASPQGGTSE